jgi:hypothetical protein
MKTLNDTIRANRFDVFRHTLRSIALATAAASGVGLAGLSGCADAHVLGGDQGTPWAVACSPDAGAGMTDLTGLPLPEGVEGLLVYATRFYGQTPTYVAGDFCLVGPDGTDCTAGIWDAGLDPDRSFSIFVRRGDVVERVSLEEVLGGSITTPQAAVLAALAADYHIVCAADPTTGVLPGEVARSGREFEVTGNRFTCEQVFEGTVLVAASGSVRVLDERVVADHSCVVEGRLTAGSAVPGRPQTGSDVGRYFAQVAGLEAAAVDAFERMAAELSAMGAPAELVEWARVSAEDERRHARDMGALANRFGVLPGAHAPQAFALRGLFEVALENAVEGCVRETYGAVVGHHQAQRAQDPVVRAAMVQVAEDETRHAALSWSVAEWALPQLSEAQRMAIRAAQRGAIDALTRSVSIPEADALVQDAGLPAPRAALVMLQALGQQVWA